MLVVRVVLGKTEVSEQKAEGESYDTVVGGSDKLFREFVKTNEAQILPEFLINYDRVDYMDTQV